MSEEEKAKLKSVSPVDQTDSASESADEAEQDNELEQLATQLDEMKDKHLRVAAELDNLRRRSEKERIDLIKYGNETIVTELLTVMDSFDKALDQVEGSEQDSETNPVTEGLRMIHKQFASVLQKSGVEELDPGNGDFDPNCHQAVQMIPSEDVEGEKIKDVYAKGYKLNGRLIRAAMVSVLVPK